MLGLRPSPLPMGSSQSVVGYFLPIWFIACWSQQNVFMHGCKCTTMGASLQRALPVTPVTAAPFFPITLGFLIYQNFKPNQIFITSKTIITSCFVLPLTIFCHCYLVFGRKVLCNIPSLLPKSAFYALKVAKISKKRDIRHVQT